MNICLLCRERAFPTAKMRGFSRGTLSHIADGDTLRVKRTLPFDTADTLVISATRLNRNIVPHICAEADRMHAHGVFIDSEFSPDEEVVASFSERGFSVFAPFTERFPKNAIPVIEASVSGGSLEEYFDAIRSRFPRFAVSIRLSAIELPLPAEKGSDAPLSPQELRRLLSRFDPDVFFSPHLCFKYFIYEPSQTRANLVLFDDAETISHKLRLAKKHGASHAFLIWDDVCDIFDKIFF